jgi:hypothetical protein
VSVSENKGKCKETKSRVKGQSKGWRSWRENRLSQRKIGEGVGDSG